MVGGRKGKPRGWQLGSQSFPQRPTQTHQGFSRANRRHVPAGRALWGQHVLARGTSGLRSGEDEAGLAALRRAAPVWPGGPSLLTPGQTERPGPGQMGSPCLSAPRAEASADPEPARYLGPQPAVPSKGPVFQSKDLLFQLNLSFSAIFRLLGWMERPGGAGRAWWAQLPSGQSRGQ